MFVRTTVLSFGTGVGKSTVDSLVHAARALTAKMLKMRLLKRIPDRFGLRHKRPTRTHRACYGNVKGTLEFEDGCGCAAQNENEVEDECGCAAQNKNEVEDECGCAAQNEDEDEDEDEVEVEDEVENGGAVWRLKLKTAN
jgi:hypothetical protein